MEKYSRGRRGVPAKDVGRVYPAREFKSLLLRQKSTSVARGLSIFLFDYCPNLICTARIIREISRLRREYPHPAPDKQACRASGGVCEVDSTSKARRATSPKLHNNDARRCASLLCRDIETVITEVGYRTLADIEICLISNFTRY